MFYFFNRIAHQCFSCIVLNITWVINIKFRAESNQFKYIILQISEQLFQRFSKCVMSF